MNRVITYLISLAGIAVMAIGLGIVPIKITQLEGIAANTITGVGIALIVVGVFLTLKFSEGGGKEKYVEIPIYEGVGKKRRVVGYSRE